MKVILNDYIEHLGERGDSVVVKPGFARNYLLPKGLAYPDTPGNRRRFDQEQKHWEEMDLSRRSAAEVLARELDGIELVFERRAGEKDVLFGSVSVADIANELAAKGFELERRRVLLDHPIKELGNFEVDINVHRDIKVTLPVFVVRPGDEPSRGDVGEGAAPDAAATTDAGPAAPETLEAAAFTGPEPLLEPEIEIEPEGVEE
jgi:large subunit ribosomal protein L9